MPRRPSRVQEEPAKYYDRRRVLWEIAERPVEFSPELPSRRPARFSPVARGHWIFPQGRGDSGHSASSSRLALAILATLPPARLALFACRVRLSP